MNLNKSKFETFFEHRANLVKQRMLRSNIALKTHIRGCSIDEILILEQRYHIVLPQSYKVFLKHFGHGLGGYVMNDIDILYDNIQGLTNILRNEVLIEKGDPSLPDKAFVFASRYEEQFMFFDASGLLEEPPIYYYIEDAENFDKVGDTIFDILDDEIKATEHYLATNRKEKISDENNKT